MSSRVRGIVDLLIEMLSDDADQPPTQIALVERLVKHGYSLAEIDAALQTVMSLPGRIILVDPDCGRVRADTPSRRVLTPAEQVSFSIDARGALQRLTDSKLITDLELEELLLEVAGTEARDLGVPELLLLLMSIIRDEGRRALIAPELLGPRAASSVN
jgi:uncharacterized protein Smg (DUF494 family)